MTLPLAQLVLAPEAGWLVIGFGIFGLWLAVTITQKGYDATLGFFLRMLANALRDVRFIGGYLARPLEQADHFIMDKLGRARADVESMMTKWWHGMEWLVRETYDAIVAFGEDIHGAIDGIVHGTIPSLIHGATHGARVTIIRQTRVVYQKIGQVERAATARAHGLEQEIEQTFGRALRGIDYIQRVALPRLWHGVHALDAEAASLGQYTRRGLGTRVGNLEKWLGVTLVGGAAIAALTRVFPWWQCSNVRRFMRGVCRSPFGSLDWLFALLAFVVVALDPLAVLHAAEDATDELEGIVRQMAGI